MVSGYDGCHSLFGVLYQLIKDLKTDNKADTIRKDAQNIKHGSGGDALGRKGIVVGGGASGMAAAIMAARQEADVMILEHMDRVGKKLLATGNGKCNLTNLSVRSDCYHSSYPDFPMKVLDLFSVRDTLLFFEELGLLTKNKNGYIYPNSEQATAVLDLLRIELNRRKIPVVLNCQIRQLKKKAGKTFTIRTSEGDFFSDFLILATGSMAAPGTGSDGSGYQLAQGFGHRIIPPLPALVQLRCEGKYFKHLAGVRCLAKVTLYSDGERLCEDSGELQLTDYGISGIPTFQVSHWAAKRLAAKKEVKAVLDFMPDKNREALSSFLIQRARQLPDMKCQDFLTGVLHKKLAFVLFKLANIPAEQLAGEVKDSSWRRLANQIKSWEVAVTATNSYEQAQVCCGGVDTRELIPETLESRLVPDLYLIGELLDVDGICGGYNLQWAWSTGCLAGMAAGSKCL